LNNPAYSYLYEYKNFLTKEEKDNIANEALALAIGDNGERLLNSIKDVDADKSVFGRLRTWLTEV
jgi:hypothetical protein